MALLCLKIDILKSYLEREIMRSGFAFTRRVLRISQMLDEYIIIYEREKIKNRG